jgi:hypothetical protein
VASFLDPRQRRVAMVRFAETMNEVMVVFRNAALMFVLPEGATLEDLAAQMARFEDRQFGEAISIDVQLRH